MCLKPWFNTKTGKTTPCGKCIGCRQDEMKLWTKRTETEAKKGRNTFLTLTYDTEHLHYKDNQILASLDKEGLKAWLNNLKTQIRQMKTLPEGCRKKFAYYAIGEYGGIFKRPHYHILILGLDWHDFKKFYQKTWHNGNIESKPIATAQIKYVLNYSMKNINGKMAMEIYDNRGVERTFRLVSKGYGADYIKSKAEELNRTGYITEGGRKCNVPTYYKNMYLRYDAESIQSREAEKLEILSQKRQRANANARTLEEQAEHERKTIQQQEIEIYRRQNKPIEIDYVNDWWTTSENILIKQEI